MPHALRYTWSPLPLCILPFRIGAHSVFLWSGGEWQTEPQPRSFGNALYLTDLLPWLIPSPSPSVPPQQTVHWLLL